MGLGHEVEGVRVLGWVKWLEGGLRQMGLQVSFQSDFFKCRWLVDEIRESSPKELDFLFEARNSEKCLDNFKRLSPGIADCIYVPKVYWGLSTSKVLTMEYMDAAEITDLSTITSLGIRLSDVSRLVSQAFAEMIFRHGFVHCDPHAANMMVRPLPSGRWNIFDKVSFFGWSSFWILHFTILFTVFSIVKIPDIAA
ncbi:hypothetical protein HPP92_028025 [Vanilla planifolia]|uniref:ABC1 atypical kinase-like domain-containing protein n=1 Tax=Vanilla planifolia TaxID=51239 RepID=A0A835PAQ4_VANPL|nr:hypothetical protein HPP92_028025 [Vanilla planifolia]